MAGTAPKKQILEHLHQGELAQARALFSQFELVAPIDHFDQYSLQAKMYLYEGHYHKALPCLEACLVIAPYELETMVDLALCYYHLGLIVACEEKLQMASLHLRNSLNLISPQAALDHGILIAKIFEERSLLDEALDTLSLLQRLPLCGKQEQVLRIQILRLAVEMQDKKTTTSLYHQIIKGLSENLNFDIEREHILLLADCFLFGFDSAVERFNDILEKNLCPPDRSFIVSEMTEMAILSGQMDFLKTHPPIVGSENEYERSQAQVVQAHFDGVQPSFHITRLEKVLSPMSLLRFLRQVLLLFPHSRQRNQWILRYKFHCQQLSDKNLAGKFQKILVKEHQPMLVNSMHKLVSYCGREEYFESPIFWQLVKNFSRGQCEIPLDMTVETVYQEHLNEQHFDRLRMAISRLNKKFQQFFNIDLVFKVTPSKVILLVPIEDLEK